LAFTTFAAAGIAGGAAAEVPTGGMATPLVVMAYTGMVSSGLQTLNGAARVLEILRNPGGNTLQQLDSSLFYAYATVVVDFIGLSTSLVSLPYAMRNLLAVLERRGGLVAFDQFKNLSRAQRTELVKKAIAQASRTEDGQKEVMAALKGAKIDSTGGKKLAKKGTNYIERGVATGKVLSAITARRIHEGYKELALTAASFAVSATPQSLTGSGSGAMNWFYMHLIESGN
ncbi:MAG: hypothetical protein KDA85_19640, partial [Planctomycetaceae bacterium]|nr:hypothetical protein [Planctomycetaceae bacterium]